MEQKKENIYVKVKSWLLDESLYYPGQNGKYINLVLIPTKGPNNEYGVVQQQTEAQKQKGERNTWCGDANSASQLFNGNNQGQQSYNQSPQRNANFQGSQASQQSERPMTQTMTSQASDWSKNDEIPF